MHEFFENFVDEDTEEAWALVKAEMPWNFASKDDKAIFALKLSYMEQMVDSNFKVDELSVNAADKTLWAESHIEPGFSVGQDGFYPYVIDCQSITVIDYVPTSLEGIYRADAPWPEGDRASAISFLAISCIRCQLLALEGDTEAEFEPDDFDDWVEEDCPACHGEGEWVYDPL